MAKANQEAQENAQVVLSMKYEEQADGKIGVGWVGLSPDYLMAINQIDHMAVILKNNYYRYLNEQRKKLMEERVKKMDDLKAEKDKIEQGEPTPASPSADPTA